MHLLPEAQLCRSLPEPFDFRCISDLDERVVDDKQRVRRDVVGKRGKRESRHLSYSQLLWISIVLSSRHLSVFRGHFHASCGSSPPRLQNNLACDERTADMLFFASSHYSFDVPSACIFFKLRC